MSITKTESAIHFFRAMEQLGIDYSTAQRLRRIEMTLSRWYELECGNGNDYASWAIERDEASGKPFMVTYPYSGRSYRRPIPDKEAGAKKRLAGIMAGLPDLWAYTRTDPRGCALYVGRKSEIPAGEPLARFYTRGVAVCF